MLKLMAFFWSFRPYIDIFCILTDKKTAANFPKAVKLLMHRTVKKEHMIFVALVDQTKGFLLNRRKNMYIVYAHIDSIQFISQ